MIRIKIIIIAIILATISCSPMEVFGEVATEVPPIIVPTFTPEPTAIVEPAAAITRLEEGAVYQVAVGHLNMRKCGNIDCPIIKVLALNDKFTVLSSDAIDPWCLIDFDGTVGWINTEYTTRGEE